MSLLCYEALNAEKLVTYLKANKGYRQIEIHKGNLVCSHYMYYENNKVWDEGIQGEEKGYLDDMFIDKHFKTRFKVIS